MKPTLRASIVFLASLFISLSVGCGHYRLGTGAQPTFKSLYVQPVENKTTLPQVREILSTHVREAFARSGRVSLVNSPEQADAILTIVIADFHRDIAAVREGDTGLARKFDLTLGVDCTLKHRDGKVLFENRRVVSRRAAFTDSGQLQSEYQTVPLLAEALASKITHAALDVW